MRRGEGWNEERGGVGMRRGGRGWNVRGEDVKCAGSQHKGCGLMRHPPIELHAVLYVHTHTHMK